jgi:hypothetical protein
MKTPLLFLLLLPLPLTHAYCVNQPVPTDGYGVEIGFNQTPNYSTTWLIQSVSDGVNIQTTITTNNGTNTANITYPPGSTIELCRYDVENFSVTATPPRPLAAVSKTSQTYLTNQEYTTSDLPTALTSTLTAIIITLGSMSALLITGLILHHLRAK